MSKKKVQSVFRDLYPADQAAEMEMRSLLLQGLGSWLADSGMTQNEAAKVLAVTQARVSDIKRGKISSFSLDLLVRLAARAGLNPKLKLVASLVISRFFYNPLVRRCDSKRASSDGYAARRFFSA
jgi:predicted XRE-type DNA-binding protein